MKSVHSVYSTLVEGNERTLPDLAKSGGVPFKGEIHKILPKNFLSLVVDTVDFEETGVEEHLLTLAINRSMEEVVVSVGLKLEKISPAPDFTHLRMKAVNEPNHNGSGIKSKGLATVISSGGKGAGSQTPSSYKKAS